MVDQKKNSDTARDARSSTGRQETTVKMYTMHVTVHGGPETTVKLYMMHGTVHCGPETTAKLYTMHGTVHGGPEKNSRTVGDARSSTRWTRNNSKTVHNARIYISINIRLLTKNVKTHSGYKTGEINVNIAYNNKIEIQI